MYQRSTLFAFFLTLATTLVLSGQSDGFLQQLGGVSPDIKITTASDDWAPLSAVLIQRARTFSFGDGGAGAQVWYLEMVCQQPIEYVDTPQPPRKGYRLRFLDEHGKEIAMFDLRRSNVLRLSASGKGMPYTYRFNLMSIPLVLFDYAETLEITRVGPSRF